MAHTNEYGSVNGQSCSYVRLGRYNNCSAAEVNRAPVLSTNDYTYKGGLPSGGGGGGGGSAQNAPVNSIMVGSDGLPVTNSLTYGGACGGYPNILSAYGSESGNCVTNFINN